ncbi:Similar to Mical: [F-actin]-monooxygenase Mical (Drosophila melanogaster) [Cotesia congregata]|uniref:F-actin monooxygenase n=1 Tax=Cotesia congregata TaxID=51543 RepID=A0A8J2MHY6_COTCN|nr:Similar to Mical: [F-actin]-monooxygenase Mical (Drosophila melanogaster) [Cotesia congregata]
MMQDHGHHSSRKTLVASPEVAMASEVFDLFCNAATLKSILGHFRHLCDLLNMRPNTFPQFYPKFKSKLRSWKAQALWKKFDQRANHKCYNRGKACPNSRVLIIGGGPCGLRAAIEAQLLGAKVVVVEKRDRMSRNNVLHLWPFVIQDLRALGAKKFFGKFCAGSIDHISIRQLQCILLKVSLILGVEFHEGVSFDALIPPPESQDEGKIGWRAKTTPSDHPVSQYEFDVLIGADGKRNTLEGFRRKEFRGKLAIAITANFINKRTEAEARVEEISGVAFIFNQKFFKELYQETGIDLENIVYYKDDTHYFVMTAKKHSLIDKGVILQDHADTAKLLAKENVDRDALMLYAREAADFSTQYQMMDMEFAVNHYGQPDVAMFDFTSMYAAENASRVLERHGHRLLMTLVGDSLLEPFWPTGSGCARGFLSSMDAGWAIKGWGASSSPLEVLAERESIYRLLGQTTPENLNRDYAAYTLDPHTRYPNLNVRSVSTIQVRGLLDTDDPDNIKPLPVLSSVDVPKKRRRRDIQIHPDTLLHWLQKQVALYDTVKITDMTSSFKDGMAICAIVHRYRPDLIDFNSLKSDDVEKNNQLAYDVLEKELGISPIMTGEEMAQCDVPDKLAMFSYLTQIYEAFRGEIPHIKHPKLEPDTDDNPLYNKQLGQTLGTKLQINRLPKHETLIRPRHSRFSRHNNENVQTIVDKKAEGSLGRRSRKRRSNEKMGATVEERQKRLEEIVSNRNERMRRRQFLRKMATQQFYKSLQMLQANAKRDKEEPFEDYSIFLYRQTAPDFKDRVKELEQKILYPDREPKMLLQYKGGMDDDFSGRIKDIEDKLRGTTSSEKKPRDLLRAIGKIEKTDWNVKEIEKKIEENKLGKGIRQDKVERVPKWSREQFLARQIKMEKKGRDPNDPEHKYAEIDNTLKCIDRKIKEGNILGHNKVSAMAEQFANKNQDSEPKVQRSNSKAAIILPTQGGSEMCHFCDKRVYLMERLTAEGKFFHRGCFRCEYCSTSLRIGNHTFDRDKNGGRFYCTQHFGLPGTIKTRIEKKKLPLLNKENIPATSEKKKLTDKMHTLKPPLDGVAGLDLLDRGQTPERIEFENLAEMSDAEEAHSQMDEDEWTDRNFGASAAEMGSSDDISDMSDSDEENEIYEEAIDQPLTTEGTIELAKNWTLRYSHPHTTTGNSDTGSNEYEDSSDEYTSEDEETGTATEDEEDARARELRKQEVWLKMPLRESDTETGSETEVKKSSKDTLSPLSENSTAASDKLFVEAIMGNKVDLDNKEPSETTIGKVLDCNPSNEHEGIGINSLIFDETKSPEVSVIIGDNCTVGENKSNLPDLVASSPGLAEKQFASVTDQSFDDSFTEANDDFLEAQNELVTCEQLTDLRDNKMTDINKKYNYSTDNMTDNLKKNTPEKQTTLDSFNILKQEIKLRRDKKNINLTPLRPLSRETARSKMNQYFDAMKDEQLNNQTTKNVQIEPTVEIDIKSHVSNKINSKDLEKYFQSNSNENKIKNEALNSNLSNSINNIDGADPFTNQSILSDVISVSPVVLSDEISESNIPLNNLTKIEKTNDEKLSGELIKKVSVTAKEIELPKKIILTDDENATNQIPKIPERKRISRELKSKLVYDKGLSKINDEKNNETSKLTLVASDEDSSENRRENSATEISTDSEFEHDGTTPTQNEFPEITINDCFVRKTRGQYIEPKKVQVKSKIISPVNGKVKPDEKNDTGSTNKTSIIKTNNSLRPVNINAVPLVNPRKGDYLLNRTHSTEGIASKLSLELKKRYLLGGTVLGGTVIKSGSTSNVDTKLRNFTDTISQHQKLLNPAPEPSPTMQAFLQGTNKLRSTSNIPLSPISSTELLTRSPLKTVKLPEIDKSKDRQNYTRIPLPDLIKETNVMKANKDPNTTCTESSKQVNIVENEVKEEKGVNEFKMAEKVSEPIEEVHKEKIYENQEIESNKKSKINLPEISADVIQVNWNKISINKEDDNSTDDSEMDSDSLSSNSKSDLNVDNNKEQKDDETHRNLSSRSQVRDTPENLLIDDKVDKYKDEDTGMTFEPDSIECVMNVRDEINEERVNSVEPSRSINVWSRSSNNDNKNSVYDIETVNNNFKQIDLKEFCSSISNCSSPTSLASIISNKQDDSIDNDLTTAALTETEFSEWARDGEGFVIADLKDAEFDGSSRGGKLSMNNLQGSARIAKEEEDLTDIESSEGIFSCPDRTEMPTNDTSKLLADGEDIDYMDTDNESLLDSLRDATNIPLIKNRGYVEFVNVTGITSSNSKNSCSPFADAPIAKAEAEPELCSDEEKYDDNVIKINLVTVDDVRNRLSNCTINTEQRNNDIEIMKKEPLIVEAVNRDILQSMDEDSLLIVEPAEDTTTSELTTILASPEYPVSQSQTQSKANNESYKLEENNPDYLEYVKRLQSRIAEFSNAKDSIDVRKSKRKNSKNSLQECSTEIIAEEVKGPWATSNLCYNSPATSRKLEEITRERSKQKNLIQDLLMDKIEAHKQKSAEKKAKRAARNTSFNSGMQLYSPKPPHSESDKSLSNMSVTPSKTSTPTHTTFAEAKKSLEIPSTNEKRFDSKIYQEISDDDANKKKLMTNNYSDKSNSDKIISQVNNENFKTPVAPPRTKHEEARRTAEKAKQEARERARLKSDEDLGLSPEDRIKQLRLKITQRQLSMEDRRKCENEDVSNLKTRAYSFTFQKSESSLQPSKSTDNMKVLTKKIDFPATNAKSMSELAYNKDPEEKLSLDTAVKRSKKKTKDPERRRSIIQAVSDFFKKKETASSPTSPKDKGLGFSRLTTKLKERGKLKWYSEGSDIDKLDRKFDERPKSVCESILIENFMVSLPPVPPPPINYPDVTVHVSDDSLSEEDSKMTHSQLQKTANLDGSCNSISRKLKNTKKLVRQAQSKRLRIAQEIQRKLEETEVKQRDLESRGVSVEKALRGEGDSSGREETDLLGEWFDLMRERTELRRYEKELLVRAEEVQLEDRHDRLQQELRERLADDDDKKTSADVKKEGEILTEMLEIAAKRDSLVALLEEERQRYKNEEKDLEAQMLAKGLTLTPIEKDDSKYLI